MSNYEQERHSVCLVHIEDSGEKPYFKYFRIADYFPEDNPDELVPSLVQKDSVSFEEAIWNPDYLYNPGAAYNHDTRDSDFFLFRWHLDSNNANRQLTTSHYDDLSILEFPEPREVFILDGDGSEESLRDALTDGIPFDGKTTSVFYIAYGYEDGRLPAIRCQRNDFVFDDGLIKLPYMVANVKQTVLSAPRIWLDENDIIEFPYPEISHRKIYAKLTELESDGSVLLRPLEYYASDYVKWFIREEKMQVTKTNRRAISKIIDAALSRPDALEMYLGARAQEGEVQRLRDSIAHIVMEKDDPNRELFRKALLEDKGFYRECVEQVMHSSDALLEERKKELASARDELDETRGSLADLTSKVSTLEQRKAELEADAEAAHDEAERIRIGQDEILGEIQSNIALQLGLRTVAAQSNSPAAPAGLAIGEGRQVEAKLTDCSFEAVLLNNLKRLGVTSVVGKPDDELRSFALGIESALAATKFVAIPQTTARQIADSISIANSGREARRVYVPADFRDAAAVIENLTTENAVVLIDGVIDAVNEGVLFALLAENPEPIIVFSFASHASASLVAKEAWERIFLPSSESLLTYRAAARPDKLQRSSELPDIPKIAIDDALEEFRGLDDELRELDLPSGPLLLASTALLAAEELTDEDGIQRYVSQHLLMSSNGNTESFKAIAEWSDEDDGLVDLAKKLGCYES